MYKHTVPEDLTEAEQVALIAQVNAGLAALRKLDWSRAEGYFPEPKNGYSYGHAAGLKYDLESLFSRLVWDSEVAVRYKEES